MAILNICSACGMKLFFKDEQIGQQAKCPACGEVLTVSNSKAQDELQLQADPVAPRMQEPPARMEPLPVAPARVSAPPPVSLRPAGPRSIWDWRYCLLSLALLPLFMSVIGGKREELPELFKRTLENVSPEVQAELKALNDSKQLTKENLFAALPGHKLEGALLPYGTWAHWFFAALAAGAFFVLIISLFPIGAATPKELFWAGLFTGTVGIFFLLAVQFIAQWTQGVWFRGASVITVFLYIAKFIGFSYRSALDPSNGFLLSFFGFTCGVGFCEELCKALPLVRHFKRKATLDWRGACVWGLATGVGFGVSEGITYSSDYYNGFLGGDIYLIRFISCVSLHAIWSAAVGMSMYRHQLELQNTKGWLEPLLPLIKIMAVPMVLHGLYDTLLKKDMHWMAFLAAAASFVWLIWQIERSWRAEKEDVANPPSSAPRTFKRPGLGTT